jgi:hypothetical protein
MMQHLMAAYAQQQAPEKPDPRGVVELQDVLDAVAVQDTVDPVLLKLG